MAAQVSTPTPRTIRVYCPTHKVGFSTAASATIECSSGTHSLANDFPSESFWEYCCDCQHYWPIDAAKGNKPSDQCPVCERDIHRRALCAHCKVLSIESNDGGRRKAYFVSAETLIKPVCPGCSRQSVGPVQEHNCPDFGCSFFTTRPVCPFCEERLEPPPAFPCSVESYLAKLPRSAVGATFDPGTGLLKEVNAGEYFAIPIPREPSSSIVVPKSCRFESKQDYYNVYYELFNCEHPVAGEVIVLSPAIVEIVEGGWRLRETGFVQVKPDPELDSESNSVTCSHCGTPMNAAYAFCKHCGVRIHEVADDTDPGESNESPIAPATEPASSSFPSTHSAFELPAAPTGGPDTQTKVLLGIVGGILLIGIVLTIVATTSNHNASLEKQLDDAIAAGRIFGPTPDNAHDLYNRLKDSGASESQLGLYRGKLLPVLTSRPLQAINNYMVPGSDDQPLADWQSFQQSLSWARELQPNDSTLAARALYCEGRIAYLTKSEDRAIEIWTRAANADKSWPLPLNGIGLIYTARKNYQTARAYYFDAMHRDANWAYPYNNIGTTYFMEKNYSDAKDYYRKAVQAAPQWARPHSWLGDIAMKENDYNTAIQEFSLVLDAGATGTKNMDLGKIRQQLELAKQRAGAF